MIFKCVYIYLLRGKLKDAFGCGNFSLHWRPVGDLLLLSVLWSGCCLFDIFPISILNFVTLLCHRNQHLTIYDKIKYNEFLLLGFFTFYISTSLVFILYINYYKGRLRYRHMLIWNSSIHILNLRVEAVLKRYAVYKGSKQSRQKGWGA